MDVTLLYFDDCPNWEVARERLATLVTERPDLRVLDVRIDTPAEAERLGLRGSPTILVDGVDAFAEDGAEVGLSCRRYRTPDGYRGAPTLAQLRAVLTDA